MTRYDEAGEIAYLNNRIREKNSDAADMRDYVDGLKTQLAAARATIAERDAELAGLREEVHALEVVIGKTHRRLESICRDNPRIRGLAPVTIALDTIARRTAALAAAERKGEG